MNDLLIPLASPCAGKALTKRAQGKRTIMALTFNEDEAEALRHMACHLTIKHDKHPSMSLLARFGLLYVAQQYRTDPSGLAARLSRMVTEDPQAAKLKKARP